MIRKLAPEGDVAMLRLDTARIGARGYQTGSEMIEAALEEGARAILLDMAMASTLRASDIALLVELAAQALPMARLSLVNVNPVLISALRDRSVDQIISVYATLERALDAPHVKSGLLANTPAVVLSAGKGSRMAPMTQVAPKPMFEIMGKPILEHILCHLRGFGIRNVVLNPGHLGPQIPEHFGSGRKTRQSLFYINEGKRRNGRWVANPVGSASTLARWAQDHNGFSTDTIVMCGDALVDVDLPAMMACHRESEADVTIAAQRVPEDQVHKYGVMVADGGGKIIQFQEKPSRSEALSTLANTGIYILSPKIIAHLSERDGADIACHLLPAVLASGGRLQVFEKPFQWIDVGCGRDYMAAWKTALSGKIRSLTCNAEQLKPEVWVEPGAIIGHPSDIEGPAYISAGARIEGGATLRGPVVVGANSIVENGAFLRNSILCKDTCAMKGAIVDGTIASGRWAIAHAYADGSEQPWDPLPYVGDVSGHRDGVVGSRIVALDDKVTRNPLAAPTLARAS